MRTVLDTSVLIHGVSPHLRGDLAISTVSLAELHFGVLVARSDEDRAHRLRRLSEVIQAFTPLPVDEPVSRSYGALAATVARSGGSPRARALDLLFAATAHAHGARLATYNAANLQHLSHLVDVVAL